MSHPDVRKLGNDFSHLEGTCFTGAPHQLCPGSAADMQISQEELSCLLPDSRQRPDRKSCVHGGSLGQRESEAHFGISCFMYAQVIMDVARDLRTSCG